MKSDIDKNAKKCVICGKKFVGYGNNPEPVKSSGVCCDACNETIVLQARILGLARR